MSGFADVYQHLCERFPDERDRGRAFEPLVTKVLRTDPLYQAHFAEVWPWNEWPGRDGGDIGIDIVARRHDGGLSSDPMQMPGPHRQAPHRLLPF